ncbi:MAG: D-2-hydroxyacid dehydrogenase [Terriglobales bacterium]
MKLLIVLYHRSEIWRAPEWFAEGLCREFPGLEVVRRDGREVSAADFADADVVMNWSITLEQLAAAKKLRWIHSPAAAVHRLMIPELIRSDIAVTSARGLHGPVVAEHVIALVLALAKRLPSAMRYQREKRWAQELLWKENPPPREIAGATLGLVGMGSIGSEVARLASALGMKVVAVRARKGASADVRTYGPDGLETMLGEADYVVLAAPVTPETVGMMNAQRLAAMKPEAYLINVSRGALVDESALLNALEGRKIAGAALDVFEHEPLPRESPLWDVKNLLITPHSAGLTERLWQRHLDFMCENLRRFQSGAALLGLVDKLRGY